MSAVRFANVSKRTNPRRRILCGGLQPAMSEPRVCSLRPALPRGGALRSACPTPPTGCLSSGGSAWSPSMALGQHGQRRISCPAAHLLQCAQSPFDGECPSTCSAQAALSLARRMDHRFESCLCDGWSGNQRRWTQGLCLWHPWLLSRPIWTMGGNLPQLTWNPSASLWILWMGRSVMRRLIPLGRSCFWYSLGSAGP